MPEAVAMKISTSPTAEYPTLTLANPLLLSIIGLAPARPRALIVLEDAC